MRPGRNARDFAQNALVGALLGMLILHPITGAIYAPAQGGHGSSGLARSALRRIVLAFTPGMLPMTGAFALLGAGMGVALGISYRSAAGRRRRAAQLAAEFGLDLPAILERGEGETVEFKASARWDFDQRCVNRTLEDGIAKTVAGFMNHRGGTLLLGVADGGHIAGLDQDYRTLKRPDRDGLEQFVVGLVERKLGGGGLLPRPCRLSPG